MLQGKLNLSIDNPFYGKWNHLVKILSEAFRLDEKEGIALYKSKIARLIAATPYLAGCAEAERTAVCHLGIYILIVRTRDIFQTRSINSKDLFKRIRMINNFINGNQDTINRSINLILISIIAEYERGICREFLLDKVKPDEEAGLMFLTEEKKSLLRKIHAIQAPYMDEIITADEAQIEVWY